MGEKKNDQSNELKREVNRQTALLENRMKIFATAGVVFDLTSEQIEEAITDFFTDNGIDCDAEHVYVRCIWNKEWDNYINRKDTSIPVPKSDAFETYVLLRSSNKKSTNNGGGNNNNIVMNGVMKYSGNTSRTGYYILNNDKLNGLIQVQFRNNKKCEWKLTNNGSYAKVKLDFNQVLAYIFAEDKTNHRIVYDIIRKENYSNKGSHKGVFAIKILKTYYNEFKYKNSYRDPIDFIRGNK